MPDQNSSSLENLGFMLQDVARLMRREFNRRVQELELTQAQWRALVMLSRHPGLRQCHLADMLEMQPISVGRLMDRMQAAGWVERRGDPADRRAVQLFLTAQAEPVLKGLRQHGADTRAKALQGITREEQEQFFGILMRMRANMADTDSGEKCPVSDTGDEQEGDGE
jgi:DNA-binding MarR family transcriptional regulator